MNLLPALARGGGPHPFFRRRTALAPAERVRADLLHHGLGQVVPDMPAIIDLHRVRQGPANRLGVGAAAVTAHHPHTGMSTQPRFQGVGLTIGEHVDALPRDRVDDHGGVAVPFAEREVVHPDHRRHRTDRQRQAQQRPDRALP